MELRVTVAAAFIGPASSPIGLPDLYWTLLTGVWISNHRALLDTDPFTSAPHVVGPILNVQWLADVIFHGLDALGGLNMVVSGTAVVVGASDRVRRDMGLLRALRGCMDPSTLGSRKCPSPGRDCRARSLPSAPSSSRIWSQKAVCGRSILCGLERRGSRHGSQTPHARTPRGGAAARLGFCGMS